MKKIILAIAIVMASTFGINQANQNNTKMNELRVDELEAIANNGEDAMISWATVEVNCPIKDNNGKIVEIKIGYDCKEGVPGDCKTYKDDPCK